MDLRTFPRHRPFLDPRDVSGFHCFWRRETLVCGNRRLYNYLNNFRVSAKMHLNTSMLIFFIMIFLYFLYIIFLALYSTHMLVFLNNIGTGIKLLLSGFRLLGSLFGGGGDTMASYICSTLPDRIF